MTKINDTPILLIMLYSIATVILSCIAVAVITMAISVNSSAIIKSLLL